MDIYQITLIAGGIPLYLIGLFLTMHLVHEGPMDIGSKVVNVAVVLVWPLSVAVSLASIFVHFGRRDWS